MLELTGNLSLPIQAIGVVILLIGFVSLRMGPAFGFCAFVVSTLLGSAAAIAVPGLANIPPAHLLLGFVVLIVLRNGIARHVLSSRGPRLGSPFTWLIFTGLYGVIGAYFLPRLFAGCFEVSPVSASQLGEVQSFFRMPLAPTNGNITQSVYFTADIVCFFVLVAFARDERRFETLTKIFVAYCAANVIFGLLDIVTNQTGTSDLLEFMRNSSYAIYADVPVGKMRRIIGSFTEASAFAYATTGAFCFSLRLWLGDLYPRLSLALTLTLFAFLIASVSSTAYVALGPAIGLIYAGSVLRLIRGEASRQDAAFVVVSPFLLMAAIAAVALDREALNHVQDTLDALLFDKSLSQSGIDRAQANVQAYENFLETFGLGTGIGSVRASSFVLAALSNLGLVGSVCYAVFIGICLLQSSAGLTPKERAARGAARCACLGLLIAGTVSGALIDLGLAFFAFAALAFANPRDAIRTQPMRTHERFEYPGLGGPVAAHANGEC